MRLLASFRNDNEWIYWKLVELKGKYECKTWIELFETMIDIITNYEKQRRTA